MNVNNHKQTDSLLLITVMIMLVLGLAMIYSSSSFRAADQYGDLNLFVKKHLIRLGVGLCIMFIFSQIDYHYLKMITPVLMVILIILLFLAFFGNRINGSRRAVMLLGKQFQPSEFMKIGIILYLAKIFGSTWKQSELSDDQITVNFFFLLFIVGLILLEPDLGTSIIVFSLGFMIFFLAGVAYRQLLKLFVYLLPMVLGGLFVFRYQLVRIEDFINSITRSGPMSYQVEQSIIGLARGGAFGVGYGAGKQKLFFLPEPFSDFIISSLGEEMGFLGLALVFVLLAIILWRGIQIAVKAPDRYGYLLAGGVTMLIMISAVINAGVAVNLFPCTGLPFPFLSYGGSSLIALLAGVGIMLNISKQGAVSYKTFTSKRAGRSSKWRAGS